MAHEQLAEKLLTVKEAAPRVRLSKSTLDKMRVRGGGPAYRQLGGRVFYAESDLAEWVASGRRTSTSEGRA